MIAVPVLIPVTLMIAVPVLIPVTRIIAVPLLIRGSPSIICLLLWDACDQPAPGRPSRVSGGRERPGRSALQWWGGVPLHRGGTASHLVVGGQTRGRRPRSNKLARDSPRSLLAWAAPKGASRWAWWTTTDPSQVRVVRESPESAPLSELSASTSFLSSSNVGTAQECRRGLTSGPVPVRGSPAVFADAADGHILPLSPRRETSQQRTRSRHRGFSWFPNKHHRSPIKGMTSPKYSGTMSLQLMRLAAD
jgi:hypothetical protein